MWDRWTKPWERSDDTRSRRDYDAYEPAALRIAGGDADAIRSVEQAFFDLVNELNDPRRLVHATLELEREPRWLELAARHRRGPCAAGACALLDTQPRDVVALLIERHPLPSPPALLTDASLLLSYRSHSTHEDMLWDRAAALGRVDGELREVLLRTAMAKLEPLARNADRITQRLRDLEWPLRDRPRRSAEAPTYLDDASDARPHDLELGIKDIERIVGARVPVLLEAFWRVVGAIDWAPQSDEPLPGWVDDSIVELIDPLCIDGLDVAQECAAQWSDERQRRKHPELAGAPGVWIAPDRFHKMGISGGSPYEIEIDGSVDPEVLHAPETKRLLPYLRNAMMWGGMPGMAYARHLNGRARDALAILTKDLESF
jgi:hypothetical protein